MCFIDSISELSIKSIKKYFKKKLNILFRLVWENVNFCVI